MNKVILLGRLTRDPEVKTTQSDISVCSFTLAVDRKYKSASGEKQADFLSCVAWRQQAELLGKYFQKGSRVGVIGNIQTRNYDDANGKKVYVTEVIVDEIEFVDSKRDESSQGASYSAPSPVDDLLAHQAAKNTPSNVTPENGFFPVVDDEKLPFDL